MRCRLVLSTVMFTLVLFSSTTIAQTVINFDRLLGMPGPFFEARPVAVKSYF